MEKSETSDSEAIKSLAKIDTEKYDEPVQELNDIIVVHMDIREPLSKLKSALEQKTGIDFKKYQFTLQETQELEQHKNLVDQCVEGEGIVQINVQIQSKKHTINIVDVLKPTDEVLEKFAKKKLLNKSSSKEMTHQKNVFRNDQGKWIIDSNCEFKKDQIKLNIPDNPNDWTVEQVQHWLKWAIKEFNLLNVNTSEWKMNGQQLCTMSQKEFDKRVPLDSNGIFYTHFELLTKNKLIAVLQNEETKKNISTDNCVDGDSDKKILRRTIKSSYNDDIIITSEWEKQMQLMQTSSGHVQLWQFLLELLIDYHFHSVIQWISPDGEFRMIDPFAVAKLWGIKKNKPSMNYEKLSRALRYYYDGDMITKVPGKRFVYKFVCDLKQLIGYDVSELARLVNQCKGYDPDATLLSHSSNLD